MANFCFLPIIWFFYPETANRSLEEIDIIFAKGYVEKMSYVKAAADLPLLSHEEVEREALRYGLIETAARGTGVPGLRERRRYDSDASEKPEDDQHTVNDNSSSDDVINEGNLEAGFGNGIKTG